ncbi:hypothetical protein HX866_03980 [Pseudomonas gingeri]|uniref:hypothetical protein n=1 Tax=Pseudomonas gingeri TaxID=117681 RepID=UPI00159F775E|nr:hypothetical protein [Pseudomonas gingeri]NWA24041.1 hypothetical protein [Pseudomonas gingeri]
MNILKTIHSWLSGRVATTQNEDSKMPDDLIQSGVPAGAQSSLQPQEAGSSQVSVVDAGILVAAKPIVAAAALADDLDAPAPDVIEKLEGILEAIGHKLPVYWREAVALAKKAV